MRRFVAAFAFATALLVAGCSSTSQQVVGTWKGELVPPTESTPAKGDSDLGKSLASGIKGFINAFVGPLTLEFNADGKYKASVALGSSTGTYSVSGNEITLTPDDKDKDNGNGKANLKFGKFEISSDGKSLHSKKEFDSDSVIELKKQ